MNNVPVTGVLFNSNGVNPLHSHNLLITSWNGQPVHTHEFKGITTFDVGHDHRFMGKTEPAPSGVQHNHRYCTFTSFDAEHKHVIRGVTGPAIFLPDGRHYHKFCGVTTVDGEIPHRHQYEGCTCP